MRKVDFIICGAQKSGTSALDESLRQHPKIRMAVRKEVHFFDSDFKEQSNYSDYHAMFDFSDHSKIFGEATPIYMWWWGAPRKIWEYNPEIKLIMILRNPIERAYSHWNMEHTRNADKLNFWDAIHCEELRAKQSLPYQHRVFSYIDRGFYTHQLRRIMSFFSRDKLLILKSDDFKSDKQGTLDKICEFLIVDKFRLVDIGNFGVGKYDSNITEREKNYLKNIFEFEIKSLERMLDWNCENWLL